MGKLSSKATVITSLQDVQRLRSSPTKLLGIDGPVELLVPGLGQAERERFASHLSELLGVCGCTEGSFVGGIALIASVVVWFQRDIAVSIEPLLATGGIVICAVLLGKCVRVIAARLQVRMVLGDLQDALQTRIVSHQ